MTAHLVFAQGLARTAGVRLAWAGYEFVLMSLVAHARAYRALARDAVRTRLIPARKRRLRQATSEFQRFAETNSRDIAPLFAIVARRITKDPELLELASHARPGQGVPYLFFASVGYLLLQGVSHPLREYYAEVTRPVRDPSDVYAVFRSFCVEHRAELESMLAKRIVQTNEVGRSAALLPAFEVVSRETNRTPLAIVELGSSAGLNLLWDRYWFDYGGGKTYGDPASRVRLICETRGDHVPPIPTQPIEIAFRLGIDLNPLDLRDPESVLWLRALVSRKDPRRSEAFETAVNLAREEPVPVMRADAITAVRGALERAPVNATLCVFHSYFAEQLSEAQRERLAEEMLEFSRQRDIYRISLEYEWREDRSLLVVDSYHAGSVSKQVLAAADSRGMWIEWLGTPSDRGIPPRLAAPAPAAAKMAHDLRAAEFEGAPALVLGLGCNGLSFVRSLGSKGIPVFALDTWRDAAGFSRYARPYVVPDPVLHEAELLAFLLEMGESLPRRAVLLSTSDAYAMFVSKHQAELSRRFDMNVPDYDTVNRLVNKRLQHESAVRAGLPTPVTLYPSDEGIESVSERIPYPCIVKPCVSHLWRTYDGARTGGHWGKAVEARSPAELVRTFHEIDADGLEMLVQEEVPGGDDCLIALQTCLNRASEPVAVFTKRKLRQFPPHFGDSCFQTGHVEEEAARLGLNFLRSLHFRGPAGVEFKRSPRDGTLKLIEVNPRSMATTQNAVVSGVDIPYIAYQEARGAAVESPTGFREGIKWIWAGRDLKSFLAHRGVGDLSFRRWVSSWRGPRCYAFFTWTDPLPAVVAWGEFLLTRKRKFQAPRAG